jgi:hypothetical protein
MRCVGGAHISGTARARSAESDDGMIAQLALAQAVPGYCKHGKDAVQYTNVGHHDQVG